MQLYLDEIATKVTPRYAPDVRPRNRTIGLGLARRAITIYDYSSHEQDVMRKIQLKDAKAIGGGGSGFTR